jgi:cell division protein YceG involved in septum cleavage
MFSKDIMEMLIQVLKSWEVLFVTVGLVIYIFIVNYVSRSYRRPRVKREKKIKVKKSEPVAETIEEDEDGGSIDNSNDELGLEEA